MPIIKAADLQPGMIVLGWGPGTIKTVERWDGHFIRGTYTNQRYKGTQTFNQLLVADLEIKEQIPPEWGEVCP